MAVSDASMRANSLSRYKPTRSQILSTRSGSGDTLKECWRHGVSPNAARSRARSCGRSHASSPAPGSTRACPHPAWTPGPPPRSLRPRRRRYGEPPPVGARRPGRPVGLPAKRCRHFATVVGCAPNSAAMSRSVRPSPQPNTILDRSANACDDLCRRDPPMQGLALRGAQRDLRCRSSPACPGVPLKLVDTGKREPRTQNSLSDNIPRRNNLPGH
jgi:hypothetical protein